MGVVPFSAQAGGFVYAAVICADGRVFPYSGDPNRDWLVDEEGDDYIVISNRGRTRRVDNPRKVTKVGGIR